MKREEQFAINVMCEEIWKAAMKEWDNVDTITHKKLRSCQATVF